MIALLTVVFIERDNQEAIVRFCPSHVPSEVIFQPPITPRDRAVMHVIVQVGYNEGDGRKTVEPSQGGKVAKKLGDGLMALFGYPVAQENDAERAVRAALSIQRALAELNRQNEGAGKPAMAARLAIDTGP